MMKKNNILTIAINPIIGLDENRVDINKVTKRKAKKNIICLGTLTNFLVCNPNSCINNKNNKVVAKKVI